MMILDGLRSRTALTRVGATLSVLAVSSNMAMALPQDGRVVGGSATITQTSPTGIVVNQGSSRAVIDWRTFSLGSSETAQFVQPGAGSIAFNRVTGIDPSVIAGHLTANGQVVLINPNGVLFDRGAQVNVGGLVASTSGITTANAMAGKYLFDKSSARPGATVVNRGTITAAQGGLVALVAPGVANSGTITATLGKVSLAAGDKWTLDLYGDHLVNFAVNDQVAQTVAGPDGTGAGVSHTGTISAAGGKVELSANLAKGIVSNAINMNGIIEASSISTAGGVINLEAGTGGVAIGGTADASGATGGTITVHGGAVTHAGTLRADGSAGAGGTITVAADTTYIDTAGAVTSASGMGNGAAAQGGAISVAAGSSLYSAGRHLATSAHGKGGNVTLTAPATSLVGTDVNVSGATGGGTIAVGGGAHGGGPVAHALTTFVSASATLHADATTGGEGGTITIWSDSDTDFAGFASARGGFSFGNGGHVEISSAAADVYAGTVDAGATAGEAGSLLLDPKSITVAAAVAGIPSFDLVNPDPTLGSTFGSVSVDLSTGNLVVTDPTATIGSGPAGAGAAYLFNGLTGQLISAVTGSHAADAVGASVTALGGNGNYVVGAPGWNGGEGAAIWGSGTLGVSGTVSAANALTGTSAGDHVGASVTALSDGNYVVGSPTWNGGRGAATWGSGSVGVTGTVSASNSLTGSSAGDGVGASVTVLANGNYVVGSPNWNGGVGAASWGLGTAGINGAVSIVNSLTGTNVNDHVGLSVTALTNGDYVAASANWNGGRGEAAWGNGAAGTEGVVSAADALIGGTAGDGVGASVTALTNGNYVVGSPNWNGGEGAVVWGSGTVGVSGTVSAATALTGTLPGDHVGTSVAALANGDFVVVSPNWSLGKGAATWGNGGVALHGGVSAGNSLTGSLPGDGVGLAVTALANGNYVVGLPGWEGDEGAAVWGLGTAGVVGAASAADALVGTLVTDHVGAGVTALLDGNYVVQSPLWGGTRGAASWGDGTTGVHGSVTASNSLTGDLVGDEVGLHVAALTDGNYVVGSPDWHGTTGAASWGSGSVGIAGSITSGNSLLGSAIGDETGSGVTSLAGGAYVVTSIGWNGGMGAVSISTGGALTGTVGLGNSIEGAAALLSPLLNVLPQAAGSGLTLSFAGDPGGRVVEAMLNPNGLTYGFDASGAMSVTPGYLTRTLDTGTSVTLQASDDITISSPIIVSAGGMGGDLTLAAGRSVLIDAAIDTDGGDLSIIANDTAADGVVSAARDAGAATIAMAAGSSLSTGAGTVSLDLRTGTGIANASGGNISLQTVIASQVSAIDETGGTLALGGVLTATGSGNAIVLSGGAIDNTAGAGALAASAGRFILYSASPAGNALDGSPASPSITATRLPPTLHRRWGRETGLYMR